MEFASGGPDNDNLTQQLAKLNQKLDSIDLNKSRFVVYNANPLKFAGYNFIAGTFHSLGRLFGTAVIAGILIYFFSQIDLISAVTNWLEQVMSKMNWQQIIPTNDQLLHQIQR